MGLDILDLEFSGLVEIGLRFLVSNPSDPFFPARYRERYVIRYKHLGEDVMSSYILYVKFTKSEDIRMVYRCANSNSLVNLEES